MLTTPPTLHKLALCQRKALICYGFLKNLKNYLSEKSSLLDSYKYFE